MTHPRLGRRRGVRGALSLACASLLALLLCEPLGLARAGEFDRSTLPTAAADPEHCDAGGQRSVGVLKNSRNCRRISGYIAAGAQFGSGGEIGGRESPFGKFDAPEFVGAVRAAGAALIAVPAGLDRIFLPPSAADEAR